ncbi:hypothetical protein HHI36_021485 [Cryptolaemus montrouzieri]|uniref:BOP1 N-terminal domain-containing protein n=1 Tax=Cryptolaemus montrouzieri TaxID=559131 RepID=A0ABD2MXQ2_9CUCU
MGNKQKRKLDITKKSEVLKQNEETSEKEIDSADEELFNTVNGEEEDSSDSEREIEESEDEDNQFIEEESEGSDANLSEDSASEESKDSEEEESDCDSGEEESAEEEEETDEENEEKDSENKVHSERKKAPEASKSKDIRNTVGNVPKNWYNEYKHFGYDWDGDKIIKPQTGDRIDEFLKRMEDPNFWRTVKDPQTGQDVVLSEEDIEIIRRMRAGKIPDVSFDEYAPWIEWFTSEVMQTPLRKFPEHKRSFLPSKHEARKVSKLVHALKMGWIKTREEAAKLRAKKEPQFYMLWKTDDQAEDMRRIQKHIPPPKRFVTGLTSKLKFILNNFFARLLPTHAESYNPPPEYLFDEKELKQWNKHKDAPWKRKLHFVPQKYESLRMVPSYKR